MKIPDKKYFICGGIGVIIIYILTTLIEFVGVVTETFYNLQDRSPFIAKSLIVIIISLILLLLYLLLRSKLNNYRAKIQPTDKKRSYSGSSPEEELENIKKILNDPERAVKSPNMPTVQLDNGSLNLTIYGYKSVGKSSLSMALKNPNTLTNQNKGHSLNITIEEFDLTIDDETKDLPQDVFENPSRFFIFMSDKDLRNWELEKFKKIIKNSSNNVIFALNKTDILATEAVKEIKNSICDKFNKLINSSNFVTIAAAPHPKIRIKIDEFGKRREEEEQTQPDIYQLTRWLEKIAKKQGYNDIQFC